MGGRPSANLGSVMGSGLEVSQESIDRMILTFERRRWKEAQDKEQLHLNTTKWDEKTIMPFTFSATNIEHFLDISIISALLVLKVQ